MLRLIISLRMKAYISYSRSPEDGLTEIEALSNVIQSAIAAIKASTAAKGAGFPSSSTPIAAESEAIRNLPEIEQACSHIISAANQLIFAVRSPYQSVIAVSMQVGSSAHESVLTLTYASSASAFSMHWSRYGS